MKLRTVLQLTASLWLSTQLAGTGWAQHHSKPCPPVVPGDCPPATSSSGDKPQLLPPSNSTGSNTGNMIDNSINPSLYAAQNLGGAERARDDAPFMQGNFLGTGSRFGGSSIRVPVYQRQTYLGLGVIEGPASNLQFYDSNFVNGSLYSKPTTDIPGQLTPGATYALEKSQQDWLPLPPPHTIVKGKATITEDINQFLDQTADVDYTQISGFRSVAITTPGDTGAGVGRFNISDNNSPMPRDRVFLNYNMFHNSILGGNDIQKLTPGFEKTFFDGYTSIELRAPFASTLASTQLGDVVTNNQNSQFGNLSLAFKGLALSGDVWNVSLGFGLSLPTGQDANVYQSDGTHMLQVKNSSVQMSPFFGVLYTPNENLFIQGFSQLSFGLNGSNVYANLDDNGSLTNIGKINDRTIWSTDLNFGYWIVRDSCSTVSGFAPMIEVHYNQTVGNADVIDTGGFRIGDVIGSYNDVNMTFATVLELRNNTTITTGLVIPLTGTNQRQFDYEVGVLLNYRFGARNAVSNSPVMFGN